jgi:hypothetical protein
VAEEGRVVEQPLHRDLHERPHLAVDLVGHVVAHERGVVEEAVALQDARRPRIHVPRRRPVAGGLHPELIAQDGELLHHDHLFLLGVEKAHRLVHVPVGPDLVAGVADALRRREVVLHRPAGNVEARAKLQPVHEPEDTVHPHPGAEAPLLEIGEAPLGLLGLPEVEAGLRVEVEGQDHRRLFAVGPPVAHG